MLQAKPLHRDASDARPAASARPAITMLYFVGAGPAAAQRVDVADLFGRRLCTLGLAVDWYLLSNEPGPPAGRRDFHGRPARVCGRSSLPGVAGRVLGKLQRVLAALHFAGAAWRGQQQIVQVRDDFLAGVLGLLAARLSGKRFVFWLSYPFPEARLADAREGRARLKAYAWLAGHLSAIALYRIILPRVDHAFVQSAQMRRDVLKAGIDPARLTAVPMGIPDEEVPARPAPPAEDALVLYLGTLARVRRLDMIVRAFQQVVAKRPDARLLIVGEGDLPQDRAALEAEVARLGLQRHVEFTGLVPRPQALDWVRRASVCLSPFYPTFVLRSTSPTKLVEYMAMGKAVVANDHPEQADVLAASGGGLCTPWNESAFAQAIVTLLDDPEARAAAGVRGRQWVLHNRLYSGLALQLRQHYEQILAQP